MTQDAKSEKTDVSKDVSPDDEVRITPEKLGITMDKRVNMAVAAVVAIIGGGILATARNIRRGAIRDPLTERGLPDVVGIFLLIAGIVLVVNQLRTWSALPGHFTVEEGKKDEEGYPASCVRAFSIVAASMLWVWLLNPLGYLIATLLFMTAFALIMGERAWWKIIVYPAAYTLVTWYVFSQPLQIILPLGPLTGLARSLGLTP